MNHHIDICFLLIHLYVRINKTRQNNWSCKEATCLKRNAFWNVRRFIRNGGGNHRTLKILEWNTDEGCGVCPGIFSWLWWICWVGSFKRLFQPLYSKQRIKRKFKKPRCIWNKDSRCGLHPAQQSSQMTLAFGMELTKEEGLVCETLIFAGVDLAGFAWLRGNSGSGGLCPIP